MNCSCIVQVDHYGEDDDTFEVLTVSHPTAKKKHKCNECRREILPGERYEVQRYSANHNLETHTTCSTCLEIRDIFFCDGYVYGWMYDNFNDSLYDDGCDLSEACIASLSSEARAVVCGFIENCWESYRKEEESMSEIYENINNKYVL